MRADRNEAAKMLRAPRQRLRVGLGLEERAAGKNEEPRERAGLEKLKHSRVELEATRLHSSAACAGSRVDAQEGFGLGHFSIPFAQLLGRQKVDKSLAGSDPN